MRAAHVLFALHDVTSELPSRAPPDLAGQPGDVFGKASGQAAASNPFLGSSGGDWHAVRSSRSPSELAAALLHGLLQADGAMAKPDRAGC